MCTSTFRSVLVVYPESSVYNNDMAWYWQMTSQSKLPAEQARTNRSKFCFSSAINLSSCADIDMLKDSMSILSLSDKHCPSKGGQCTKHTARLCSDGDFQRRETSPHWEDVWRDEDCRDTNDVCRDAWVYVQGVRSLDLCLRSFISGMHVVHKWVFIWK